MKNTLIKKLTAAATAFAMIGGAVRFPTGDQPLFGRIFTANAETSTATFDSGSGVLTLHGNVVKEDVQAWAWQEKWEERKEGYDKIKKILCAEGTVFPEDCSGMFTRFYDLDKIDLSNADTSNVTNMEGMFYNSSVSSIDLSSLDTSNVTSMAAMCSGCSVSSIDLSGFDTSNVTNMTHMFELCRNLESLDLSSFDTSNVTNMAQMFINCTNLESLDLSNFDTSMVNDMGGMFAYCTNLKSLNISNFDTAKNNSTGGMFYKCFALEPRICIIDKIVSLDGYTGADFYFKPCEKLAKVIMSGPNGDKEITDFSSVKQEDGTYKFTYSIKPSQADELITLKAYDKDGNRLIVCDKYMGLLDHSQASCTVNANINDTKKEDVDSGDSSSKTDSKKDPVILIPGIMGSKLFKDKECTDLVWPPDKSASGLKNLKNNATNDILYVKDPSIKQNNLPSSQREYGAIDCMKDLIENLYSDLSDRDIYLFSYDWRKSNAESAAKLNDFIKSLNVDKVDIVAHSMGGLVVSWYYKTQGGEKLDKVITCGTPYEGAPHIIEVVEDGKIRENDFENICLRNVGGLTPEVITSFDGVAELLPSPKYCELLPMKKLESDEENYHSMNADEYREIIDDMFGAEKSFHAFSFMKNIRGANDYNCLSDYENSYYVIGSKGDGESKFTVKSLIFSNKKTHYIDGQDIYYEDIEYTEMGDGTVPYHSATMAGHLLGKEYKKRVKEVTADHLDVISIDQNNPDDNPIPWIEDILNDKEPNSTDTTVSYTPYKVIKVACPVDVEIGSGDDRLCSATDDLSLTSSFGRLDIIGKDNDIKMICMDEDTNLDINLTGTDIGTMDFTVRHFSDEDELLDERTFENVPLTDKTIIKTKADNNEITVLNVDIDGDGTVDETWTAKKNETVTASDKTINVTTTSPVSSSTTSTTTYISTTSSNNTTTELQLGDVNGDKTIDGRDATDVLTEYAKTSIGQVSKYSEEQRTAADVNKDGILDGRDATIILTYYAKTSTGYTGTLEEYVESIKETES